MGVQLGEPLEEVLAVAFTEREGDALDETHADDDFVSSGEREPLALLDGVIDVEGLALSVGVRVSEPLVDEHRDGETDTLWVRDVSGERDEEEEREDDAEPDASPVTEEVTLTEEDELELLEDEPAKLGDGVEEGETERDTVTDAEVESEGEMVDELVTVTVFDGISVGSAVPTADVETVTLTDADAERDGKVERDTDVDIDEERDG